MNVTDNLTRPIAGIENRTAQEVFDIMCDRIRLSASPAGVGVETRTFNMGDMVRKRSGSWWEGRVVGFYSTEQTPDGVCVQLDKPMGPVQIYPASALELVEKVSPEVQVVSEYVSEVLQQFAEPVETPPPSSHVVGNRWRAFEDTTPGYWGIELEDAGNDDDAIMYPQKIHRDTVARIVDAHNSLLAQATVYKPRSVGFSVLADNPTPSQNVVAPREAARQEAVRLVERAGLEMEEEYDLLIEDITETLLRFASISSPSPEKHVMWDETAPTREYVDTLKQEIERLRAIAIDIQAGYLEATERAEEAVKAANALQVEVDRLRAAPALQSTTEGSDNA